LSGDLQEDPAYALNSYNWISFGTREFDARRRAGYLGELDYFDHEIATEEDENENEGEHEDDDHEDYAAKAERGDNDHNNGGPVWDPETKPSDISEEEAIAMALTNRELDELNKLIMWDGLAIQLRESALPPSPSAYQFPWLPAEFIDLVSNDE
jgi:hypothetical protein